MACPRHARPIRHDDRQGDRRPQPHAQDQSVAGGGAAGKAQAGDTAVQSRRSAGSLPGADAGRPRHVRRSGADCARFCRPPVGIRGFRGPRRLRARGRSPDRALGQARGGIRKGQSHPLISPRFVSRLRCKRTGSHCAGVLMKHYTYFRSSAAFRVRIALNLKGLATEQVFIHLTKEGGKQHTPEYRAVNPQRRVPSLALDNGEILMQSPAIIEYLDEVHPKPAFLPADPVERAKVRAFAAVIGCDIHPLNNLAPLQYLKRVLKQEQPAIDAWYHHWVIEGFTALETMIRPGPYCFGGNVTLADIYLVPQMYNARRLKVPLDAFPKLVAADAALAKLPAFDQARPENQPDAE